MSLQSRLGVLAVSAVLLLPIAASGVPGGNINTTTQNEGEGLLVSPGGGPPVVIVTIPTFGILVDPTINDGDGDDDGDGDPSVSLQVPVGQSATMMAYGDDPSPTTSPATLDPDADPDDAGIDPPLNEGGTIVYAILERRPDFHYDSPLRLFRPNESSFLTGQNHLGISPGLAGSSPRFVPVGEF